LVVTDTALKGKLSEMKFAKVRPQTVPDCAPAAISPLAVITRTLVFAPLMAAAVAANPVTAETGVPETNDTGNVTVILSPDTRAVFKVKPITIFRLMAATRSASIIVNNGAVTAPPMTPVAVASLAQSLSVFTLNARLEAYGEPMVISVNVSVYVPAGAAAAAVTLMNVVSTVEPGLVKIEAGD